MAKRKAVRKKVVKKNIARGICHIAASFNNTLVTITDEMGNMIAWSSAGSLGFKGSKKSTKYAKELVVEEFANKALLLGYTRVCLHFNGSRIWKRKSVKLLQKFKIKVIAVSDLTKIAHNGCRPTKIRRL